MAVFKVLTPADIVAFSTGLIAGVDEVGRGPLVGDVVTAAVILDPNQPISGLNDSKNSVRSAVKPCLMRFVKKPCVITSAVQVLLKSMNLIFCMPLCLPCSAPLLGLISRLNSC